jgi:branched-chain amino acid aminotransferase
MGSTTMGVFEGIRAYRNTEREQLFALAMPQHYERMHQNTRLLQTSILWDGDELMAITTDLLRRKEYREDTYVRPLSFKSAEIISANCKMPRTVSRLRPLQ